MSLYFGFNYDLPSLEIGDGAKGAAKAARAAGGCYWPAHQYDVCDTKYNEDIAAACARGAVNEGLVTVVGGMTIPVRSFSFIVVSPDSWPARWCSR
jgi:hypothetical protein